MGHNWINMYEIYGSNSFVSWIEYKPKEYNGYEGKVYFMTGELIFSTAKEKIQEIIEENGFSPKDCNGYELIRAFYNIDSGDGVERECTDFSTPENFPPQIAQAIKSGKMRGMAIVPELLTKSALAEYKKILHPAQAKYDKIIKPLQAESQKIIKPYWTNYQKIIQLSQDEQVRRAAEAEYDKITMPLSDKLYKTAGPAQDEYRTAKLKVFWDLFAIQGNRVKAWRD